MIEVAATKRLGEERLGNRLLADEGLNLRLVELAVVVAGRRAIDRDEPLVGDAAALRGNVDDAVDDDRRGLGVSQQHLGVPAAAARLGIVADQHARSRDDDVVAAVGACRRPDASS